MKYLDEFLSSMVDSVSEKKRNDDKLWQGVLGQRRAILKLLTGGEYNVKVVAEAFKIPDPWDDGDISEYDAIEVMRSEAIIELVQSTPEEISRVYNWLRDERYLMI